jgi:hypothetical protein
MAVLHCWQQAFVDWSRLCGAIWGKIVKGAFLLKGVVFVGLQISPLQNKTKNKIILILIRFHFPSSVPISTRISLIFNNINTHIEHNSKLSRVPLF